MEAAIALSLSQHKISQKRATAAWDTVRPEIQALLIAGISPWVIVSVEGPRAWAVADAQAAARQADRIGQCWVVDCADAVAEARVRYAELARNSPSARGQVAQIGASTRRRPEQSVQERGK